MYNYINTQIQYSKMFEENNSIESNNLKSSGDYSVISHERTSKLKKSKQIKKQGIKEKKKNMNDVQESPKYNGSKQRKMQLQKEKNRIAAQLSRDRQKQFMEDLQNRVQELQQQIQKQVCQKCRVKLGQDSSTDQEKYDSEEFMMQQNMNMLSQIHKQDKSIFSQQPLQFYREDSSISINSIGKFLFVFMIAIAICSFSTTFQSAPSTLGAGRLMQEIMPYSSFSIHKQRKQTISILQSGISTVNDYSPQLFPLNNIPSEQGSLLYLGEDKCKAQYIENYFYPPLDLNKNYQYTGVQKNKLMNCTKPQLIMRRQQNKQGGFFQGLFTLVLDNPQILEVTTQSGGLVLSNVVPLKGLYQIQVQFMNIRKIIGQNCLN